MPLNLYDYTPLIDREGNLSPANRIIGTLRFGGTWAKEIEAQNVVITRLKKVLSDRFTLVHNFMLPETEIPIPLLLISPGGIWILAVSDTGGIYQVRGNDLLTHDVKKDDYVPAIPNLVMQTELLRRAFIDFLSKKDISVPAITPVLVFTNPGVDVSTGDSNIRVVLVDALNRFATGLLSAPVQIAGTQTKQIVELIQQVQKQRETNPSGKKPTSSQGFFQRMNYSTMQWIFLGVLVMSLLFVGMLFIALLNTP